MENEPPIPDDSTKELILKTEGDTISAARADVRKALQMLRETNALLSTDLLLDIDEKNDRDTRKP